MQLDIAVPITVAAAAVAANADAVAVTVAPQGFACVGSCGSVINGVCANVQRRDAHVTTAIVVDEHNITATTTIVAPSSIIATIISILDCTEQR